MALLWLRRGRSSLSSAASCLPAAFAANNSLSHWLMVEQWCHQQQRHSSVATTVDRSSIPVQDRYPEDTKPPALTRLVPNLLDIPELQKVHVRQLQGILRDPSTFGKKGNKLLRQIRIMPGVLSSLPGNVTKPILLNYLEVERLYHWFGIFGMLAQPYELLLLEDDGVVRNYPVVMKQWHRDAVTKQFENVVLMHMPPGRKTIVPMPVFVDGEEDSPGWKKGGYINVVRHVVHVETTWDALPRHRGMVLDVSDMDTHDRIWIKDLPLPKGVKVAEKTMMHPVIRMTGKRERKDEQMDGAEPDDATKQ